VETVGLSWVRKEPVLYFIY